MREGSSHIQEAKLQVQKLEEELHITSAPVKSSGTKDKTSQAVNCSKTPYWSDLDKKDEDAKRKVKVACITKNCTPAWLIFIFSRHS